MGGDIDPSIGHITYRETVGGGTGLSNCRLRGAVPGSGVAATTASPASFVRRK